MQFQADIRARNEDGILERILRTCRHRGFGMRSFQAAIDPGSDVIRIQIQGESERSPSLLARQIEKYYDVIDVCVEIMKQDFPDLASSTERTLPITFIRRTNYARTSN